jgi:hypothetical protein
MILESQKNVNSIHDASYASEILLAMTGRVFIFPTPFFSRPAQAEYGQEFFRKAVRALL